MEVEKRNYNSRISSEGKSHMAHKVCSLPTNKLLNMFRGPRASVNEEIHSQRKIREKAEASFGQQFKFFSFVRVLVVISLLLKYLVARSRKQQSSLLLLSVVRGPAASPSPRACQKCRLAGPIADLPIRNGISSSSLDDLLRTGLVHYSLSHICKPQSKKAT